MITDWQLFLATVVVGLYCIGSLVVAALLTWRNDGDPPA